jgi:hypothetical protein
MADLDEKYVKSQIRLAAPSGGYCLWSNNVGVLQNRYGTPVRYGLANDSKALNDRLKSSDLIGWKRVTVTQDMVGQTLAVFVAIECKKPNWRYAGTPREEAQKRWIDLVVSSGGFGQFMTDAKEL